MKVEELAARTGVTVRTLHHYHEIGLLRPSRHSTSGHRLYDSNDAIRLKKICALKQVGFSLAEIQQLLDRAGSLTRTLQQHMQALEADIQRCRDLHQMFKTVEDSMRSAGSTTVDAFIQTIEELKMNEHFAKYYTTEQMEYLKERANLVGETRIREVEAEWPRLIAEVRREMQRGTDPKSDRMLELAARWKGLVDEFTGGNAEIEQALSNMYRDNPRVANQQKGVELDDDIFSFIARSLPSDSDRDGGTSTA